MEMLHIVDVIPNVQGSLTVDEYVMFIFESMPYPRDHPIYWRAGDIVRDIFTVKIDPESGRLYKVTVIMNSQRVTIINDPLVTDDVVDGLPIVKTDDFHEKINDSNIPIYLYRSNNDFIVSINEIVTPAKCIRSGRMRLRVFDCLIYSSMAAYGDLTRGVISSCLNLII